MLDVTASFPSRALTLFLEISVSGAFRLPPFRMVTILVTSWSVKSPVICPFEEILLLMSGDERIWSSSTIASGLLRLEPVSSPSWIEPCAFMPNVTMGLMVSGSREYEAESISSPSTLSPALFERTIILSSTNFDSPLTTSFLTLGRTRYEGSEGGVGLGSVKASPAFLAAAWSASHSRKTVT